MLMKFLGRLLFPRQQPWKQQQQLKMILIVTAVALVAAAIVGAAMYFQNSRTH